MIRLFNINNYIIDTSKLSGVHGGIVEEFEQTIANFVGAKYACGVSSATNAIYLSLLDKNTTVTIPSIIPPVVCNSIITSGNKIKFRDDVSWVGDSYVLHEFEKYKIIDSAQKITKNQFKQECNPQDIMIFSFYPTKPIGSYDGGMIVSNDKDKIDRFKIMVKNGARFNPKSWKREMVTVGYKMYLNSFQAYIANENFKKLEEKYQLLARVKEKYNLEFNRNNTSDHLYRVNISNRDMVLTKAKQVGVELGIHYQCLHKNMIYSNNDQSLKNSEHESKTTISIPFHENLTDLEIEKVIRLIKKYDIEAS